MRDRLDRLGPRTTVLLIVGLAHAAGGRLGSTLGPLSEPIGIGVLLAGGALILFALLRITPRMIVGGGGALLLAALPLAPLYAGLLIAISRATGFVAAIEASEPMALALLTALLLLATLLGGITLLASFRWIERRLPGRYVA